MGSTTELLLADVHEALSTSSAAETGTGWLVLLFHWLSRDDGVSPTTSLSHSDEETSEDHIALRERKRSRSATDDISRRLGDISRSGDIEACNLARWHSAIRLIVNNRADCIWREGARCEGASKFVIHFNNCESARLHTFLP